MGHDMDMRVGLIEKITMSVTWDMGSKSMSCPDMDMARPMSPEQLNLPLSLCVYLQMLTQ